MNTTIRHLSQSPLRWLVLLALLVPATLWADPTTVDKSPESLEGSPFDDFRALDGLQRPDSEELDDHLVAADAASDTDSNLDAAGDDDFTAPDEPVALRLDYESALSYEVANRSRMEFEENPDFRHRFRSTLKVDYRPLDFAAREAMAVWKPLRDTSEDPDSSGQLVLATISDYAAGIAEPEILAAPAWNYQLFREARFSFRITDRGAIGDIHIHPPTNPVNRASLDELTELLVSSHPMLPEQPVEPGDHWTDTVELNLEDEGDNDETKLSQRIEVRYDFSDWVPCDESICALIHVGQDIEATGQTRVRRFETSTTSTAVGVGAFLLDIERGRIVQSDFNISADTSRISERETDEGKETAVEMDMKIEVDSVMKLVTGH